MEGLLWNPDGEPPEARVPYPERAVGRWEEGEVALPVFRAGAGSYGVAGGRKIHCAAQVGEGRRQIPLQKAVDQSCEHKGAELEA